MQEEFLVTMLLNNQIAGLTLLYTFYLFSCFQAGAIFSNLYYLC